MVTGKEPGASPVIPVRSVADLAEQPRFNAELYLQRLASARLGQVVLSAASLPSTQTLLRLNSAAVPDDTLCVADQQKAGKGTGAVVCHCCGVAIAPHMATDHRCHEQGAAAIAGSLRRGA